MMHFGICTFSRVIVSVVCKCVCEPLCICLSYCTRLHGSHKAAGKAQITFEVRNRRDRAKRQNERERDKERQSHLHFNWDFLDQVNAQPHSYVHAHINTC